jgi:hypothetical protein
MFYCGNSWKSLGISIVYHKGHAWVACCFVVPPAASQGPSPGSKEMPFYSDSKIVLTIY